MARFRCIACGRERDFVYDPEAPRVPALRLVRCRVRLGIDDRIAARPPPS
jgi:hypothetical protein